MSKLTKDKINVALYCRLSREDGDNSESESIENQRFMLFKYAEERDWSVHDTYIDDGYTGLNFNRPAFQRLKQDIIDKKINAIICKEQSRIGRDNSSVDKFINEFLIEKRVRCIGLIDGLDNFNPSSKKASQVIGLTNEWYSEDISNRVRAAFDTKREKGEFIGAIPPYGYTKSPDDKNKLILDLDTSMVVSEIFNLYLKGHGYVAIAKILNQRGIPTPSEQKNVFNFNKNKVKKIHWSYHTIRRILMNEVYIGHLIQRKSKKVNYKSTKKIATHISEHIRVENTHIPIILENQFRLVQEMISKKSKARPLYGKRYKFSGILVCQECGRNMTYRDDSKTFICQTSRVYGEDACSKHYLRLDDLEEYVLEDINDTMTMFAEVKKLREMHKKNTKKKPEKNLSEIELFKINKRLNEIEKLKRSLYEDYKDNILNKDEYTQFKKSYNDEEEILKIKEKVFQEVVQIDSQPNKDFETWENSYEKYLNIKELNITLINELINNIYVSEKENNVSITMDYKFKDTFDQYFENFKKTSV